MNEDINEDKQQVRPAATVIIVRDAKPQFEIFMLRRTNQAAFAGGMYVFPGGRVDDHDHAEDYDHHHGAPSTQQALQRQALGPDWRAFWIAGIRETFEESGFLLAYQSSGQLFEFSDENRQRFSLYRQQLHDGEISLRKICEQESLTLAIDLIHFYNRWITPEGRPRRFDTRFFITRTPGVQTGLHDGTETVDSCWISPTEAIRLNDKEEFGLMRVTRHQLETFAKYETADEYIAMAETNAHFPTTNPSNHPID
ncbi:MAG: hypothetical protein QNL97_02190 [Pseudomonadales bacterium]|jgi:8-oxo-dGTP pyrophosphatase MutT (NUDIX family)|tara:strand:+ start:3928 stop:4689 length:762 start_codon:yes stop_codon:yes gene_type:complete